MKNMRKTMALLMAGTMAVSMFAGCGSNANDTNTNKDNNAATGTETAKADDSAATSGDKTVIKVTKWGDGAVEQQLIDEYNKTNDKNIEVQLDAIPGDGYGDRLTTSFSSGDGYDIFLSGEGDFYKWDSLGMVQPVDDLMANDADWQNPMSDSVMNMGKVEGKQAYMIKDYNPICLWYNKDMFDEMNVDYPTDDWTWDDLHAAAEKLTTKDDNGEYKTFGFQAQSWSYAVSTYLESLGLSYVSDDYSTADGYLNSQEMADALDTYFGWAEGDDRISPTSAETDTYGDGTAMMINGKLAMFIGGGWVKASLEDAGVNYGTALVPGNHKSYYCASGYAISTSCKNQEAAWEVLKLLTGEEASTLRAEKEACFPTSQDQLDKLVASYSDAQKAMIESLDYSVSPVGMRGAVGSAVNVALGDALERIAYHDGATIDILNDAVNSLEMK